MKHYFLRLHFYWLTKLGRKIMKDYLRLTRNNIPGNFSNDPNKVITYADIQWSVAHRININQADENRYPFLNYIRNGYYINNPTVRNDGLDS